MIPSSNSVVQLGGLDGAAVGKVDEAADLERLRGPQDVLQVGVVDVDFALVGKVGAAAVLFFSY